MFKNSGWVMGALLSLTTFFSPVANGEIVVGQSIPLTGPLAKQGSAVVNGARAYIDRVNAAGGVNGQRIKLITLDDRGDSKQTAANARVLAAQGVIALFGSMKGPVYRAAARGRRAQAAADCLHGGLAAAARTGSALSVPGARGTFVGVCGAA